MSVEPGEIRMASRATYEKGGWNDGRIGQAYDLLAAVLADRGEKIFRHALLADLEALDDAEQVQP